MNQSRGVFVGTYAKNGGAGVYPVHIASGLGSGPPIAAVPNASFAAYDRARGLLHLLDEQDCGLVRTCRVDGGAWALVAEHATGGAAPCYVALDAECRQLAVANYGSGSLALFALGDDGVPSDAPRLWQSEGRGPVADRQDGPHLHCALFADGLLYVVDLGTDRIFAFDPRHDLADPTIAFAPPPGSGPRHLALHPHLPLAYLVSELAATVTVLIRDGRRLVARQTLPTAPDDYAGANLGGHIGLGRNGTRLYVTNRGHDSIALFDVAGDGSLALRQHVATAGASPRCFALLETEGLCLVANEEGQTLVRLPLLADGGLGDATDVIPLAGAAFPFVIA